MLNWGMMGLLPNMTKQDKENTGTVCALYST